MNRHVTSVAWVVAGLAVSSCAINPATGANQVMLVSEAQEIQMGQQADQKNRSARIEKHGAPAEQQE